MCACVESELDCACGGGAGCVCAESDMNCACVGLCVRAGLCWCWWTNKRVVLSDHRFAMAPIPVRLTPAPTRLRLRPGLLRLRLHLFTKIILCTSVSLPALISADLDRPKFTWDPNGYLYFRLSMGRFGNQAEQLLGSMDFVKKLNRTMVLPKFKINQQDFRFDQVFKREKFEEFLKVIDPEDFLYKLAPIRWPLRDRVIVSIYAFNPLSPDSRFTQLWEEIGVGNFSKDKLVQVGFPWNESDKWEERFPPKQVPVLALRDAPAEFPVLSEHRHLQKYLEFNEGISKFGDKYIQENFPGERFLGLHLRNGHDWEGTCNSYLTWDYPSRPTIFASPQCTEGTDKNVTMALCFPTEKEIVTQVKKVVNEMKVKVIFVATDKSPLINQLEGALKKLEVRVFHMDPELPLHDLYVLTQADHFIGNCVSSFTAFVKRHRDIQGRKTSFWGLI